MVFSEVENCQENVGHTRGEKAQNCLVNSQVQIFACFVAVVKVTKIRKGSDL